MDIVSHQPGSEPRAATGSPRPIAWADGRVVPAQEATVPLTDDGFLRGDAVFEAILVRQGRTHALDAHLARLRRSAAALDLRVPVLNRVVTDLLLAWGERDGALRVIVTRTGLVRGILGPATWPASISLGIVEAPWRTAISGVKTLSYAANQWAVRRAQHLGADDALVVDGGLVHELPTGAIGLIKDGVVSTPDPTRLPILDSVTMHSVGEIVEVVATVPTVADVRDADEIFVVSATRPVLAIHSVVVGPDDEVAYPAPGPFTERLQQRFADHIAGSLDPLPSV